ncbi:chlororespiratory reduction protein 7 [Alkalinema pantanalense CENA528]|uniref:chlororespiratory reduction protein 7 n=1 Tax=Alkalinema pantanalense TaxID=1620705 RepID=UPI003D6EE339
MSQSLMYQQDHYVVLETNQPEQFLTAAEMLEKLQQVIQTHPDVLDPDVQALPSIEVQAQYLLDTVCELKPEPGQYLQWYAIRLEK